MKKISKKLALASQTVRVLSSEQLDQVGGAGASPTTTILRHSANAAVTCVSRPNAAAAICYRLTGGVHTAPCRYPG